MRKPGDTPAPPGRGAPLPTPGANIPEDTPAPPGRGAPLPTPVGAILAGGQSRRMGTNKALLRAHSGGPTLVETVAARLREAGLETALLVTNTPEEFGFVGLRVVTDVVPGAGPLGGILTALAHLPHPRVFVVACDMPMLNPELIRYMAALPEDADAIVPRWTDDPGRVRIETLHAIYSRRCIEPLRKRIDMGKLKAADFLHDVAVRYLTDDELRPFNPHLSFRNVNTPEEWAQTPPSPIPLGDGAEG